MKKLPPLTKQYNREESKFDGPVIDWFEENYPFSCAIECKTKRGRLEPHQKITLDKVQNGKFGWKIPDMGRRNPFDGFTLKGAHAFVVVCEGKSCHASRIDDRYEFDFKIK